MLYLMEEKEVAEFFIGRTNNLDVEKSRLDCNEIISLYETNGFNNIVLVEDALIKTFYDHPYCRNEIKNGNGEKQDKNANYVYLAVWHTITRKS